MATINPLRLLTELQSAGLPCDSANTDGQYTFTRELTAEEKARAAHIAAAHEPDAVDDSAIMPAGLKDKTVAELTKTELEGLITALAQLAGLADAKGKIL